jgi:hypothetical protein
MVADNISANLALVPVIHRIPLKEWEMLNALEGHTYFNLYVKTVKNFTDIIYVISSAYKMAVLMQCVESSTAILCPELSFSNDVIPISYVSIATYL